jgi:pSer/pThr/pTyr-binding forkhead associated (FHA) protein
MAKLVLSSGGSIVYQCFLDKARLNIGRARHNQVVIDDPAVGEEHAVIIPVGNDHILQNLQSVNGTLINGSRVVRQILQHGDVMQFGVFYMRYLNPRVSADRDLERTMLITELQRRVDSAQFPAHARVVRVPSARLASISFPKGRVRVIAGSGAGDTTPLDRVVATFGKPGKELAVITRRPHGYFITHVEGRRHPRVNRRSIGREARVLHHGDVIEVAEEKLEFLLD